MCGQRPNINAFPPSSCDLYQISEHSQIEWVGIFVRRRLGNPQSNLRKRGEKVLNSHQRYRDAIQLNGVEHKLCDRFACSRGQTKFRYVPKGKQVVSCQENRTVPVFQNRS